MLQKMKKWTPDHILPWRIQVNPSLPQHQDQLSLHLVKEPAIFSRMMSISVRDKINCKIFHQYVYHKQISDSKWHAHTVHNTDLNVYTVAAKHK